MKKPYLFFPVGAVVLLVGAAVLYLIIQREDGDNLRTITRHAADGETERAVRELEALLARGGGDFATTVGAAKLALGVSPTHFDEFFRLALRRDDRESDGLLDLTEAAVEAGETEAARRLLEESLRLDAGDPRAFLLAGRFNHATGNHAEAIMFYENAFLRTTPDPVDEVRFARSLSFTGDPAKIVRAKDILHRVSEGSDAAAMDALISIGALNHIPLPEAEIAPYLERFRNHPDFPDALEGRIEVIRRLIGRFERFDVSFALDLGRVLMRGEDLTVRDRLSFAFMALKEGATDAAERALAHFEGLDREGAEYQALSAYLAMLQGRTADGLERLASLQRSHPSDPALVLITEAALFYNRPDLVHSETSELARLLLDHPLASPALQLRGYSLLIDLRPVQADRVLGEAVERYKENALGTLVLWLRERGESRIIERITRDVEDAPDRRIILGIRLDALLDLGETEQLRTELERHGDEVARGTRHILEAELAFRGESPDAAWRHWEIAYEHALARGQFFALRRLAAIGGREGDLNRSHRAYRRIFLDGGGLSIEEHRAFLALSLQRDEIGDSIRVARALAERSGASAPDINNAAYLSFLIDDASEDWVDRMRGLVRDNPDEATFRLTYALGLLRTGREREALGIAEDTRIDMTAEGSQSQAIYAKILAANNRNALASSIVANIDKTRLLPAEQGLIADLDGRR
ncbi:MAG: hypothetical protein JJU00_04125 [Opitutales bacterium]|nr:hypothetical protein [Opitutales bacterium]